MTKTVLSAESDYTDSRLIYFNFMCKTIHRVNHNYDSYSNSGVDLKRSMLTPIGSEQLIQRHDYD